MFEIPGLEEFSMAEIFNEYKKNRICINNKTKPYVFSDCYMKAHTPIIVYESNDYLSRFCNWSIYDKLQIQNQYLRYSYCEMTDNDFIYITGSLFLGSIFSIFAMINGVLKTLNKDCRVSLKLTIKPNAMAMFRIHEKLMSIDDIFTEKYCLERNKEHIIISHFNSFDNADITKFTNRFLELFVSNNPKSRIPFLSTTVKDIFNFRTLLLQHEGYLVIED